MREHFDAGGGTGAVQQELVESLERQPALAERALVDGGGDLPAADARDQRREQIGRDDGHTTRAPLAVHRPQNRHRVDGADVDARQIGMRVEHGERAPVADAFVVVRLDHLRHADAAADRVDAGLESTELLGMILRAEPPGEERHLAAAGQEARDQLPRHGSDRERIGRHRREPIGARGVGDDADDRDVPIGRAAQAGPERRRVAGRHDEPVHSAVERLVDQFHVALAQARVAAVLHLERRLERCGGLPDAVPQRIPEERDLAREVHGDAQRGPRLEVAGGEVGSIAERRRPIEHALPRGGVDARLVVQRAIDRADGDARRTGDVLDPGHYFTFHSCSPADHFGCIVISRRSAGVVTGAKATRL